MNTENKDKPIKLAQDMQPEDQAAKQRQDQDVLDQLREEGRSLRVARPLPDRELNIKEQLQVRDDFKLFVETTDGLSYAKVSKKLGDGYSASTLSAFVNWDGKEKFVGNFEEIARAINEWMENYARSLEVVRSDEWVPIRVAERMITLIKNAVRMRTMAAIYSDSGRGKTWTMKAANKQLVGSVYIRVLRTTRSPSALLKQLAKELDIKARGSYEIERLIIEKLKGTERPLLIDEAQGLYRDAFEILRDIHDECGVPIIFGGTDEMNKTLDDHINFYGQFFSRMSLKYDPRDELQNGNDGGGLIHTEDDIRLLWCKGGVRLTDAAVRYLLQLSNVLGLGGLRRCKYVMETACLIAKNKQITEKILRAIVSKMHGIDDSNKINAAILTSNLAIA